MHLKLFFLCNNIFDFFGIVYWSNNKNVSLNFAVVVVVALDNKLKIHKIISGTWQFLLSNAFFAVLFGVHLLRPKQILLPLLLSDGIAVVVVGDRIYLLIHHKMCVSWDFDTIDQIRTWQYVMPVHDFSDSYNNIIPNYIIR